MRTVALSRLIALMLVVGPAAFAAPLGPVDGPAGMPAPANTPANMAEDSVNHNASNVAEIPQGEAEANRDAVRISQQGATASPYVENPTDIDPLVKLCVIVTVKTPYEEVQTPTGPKFADANGRVFGDCQPNTEEDEGPTFTPGRINLADSDTDAGDSDNATSNGPDNGQASTADEPSSNDSTTSEDSTTPTSTDPTSTDSTPTDSTSTDSTSTDSTSTDSTSADSASTDSTPAPNNAETSGDTPSQGQEASSASGDDDAQAPTDSQEQSPSGGNQHATQGQGNGLQGFPFGTAEDVASGFSQFSPEDIVPATAQAGSPMPVAGFPPSPNSAEEFASPATGFLSTAAEETVSRISQFPPDGTPPSPFTDIHAPSALSDTDAPLDSTALPQGAIQAAQGLSPVSQASDTLLGDVNSTDLRPAVHVDVTTSESDC